MDLLTPRDRWSGGERRGSFTMTRVVLPRHHLGDSPKELVEDLPPLDQYLSILCGSHCGLGGRQLLLGSWNLTLERRNGILERFLLRGWKRWGAVRRVVLAEAEDRAIEGLQTPLKAPERRLIGGRGRGGHHPTEDLPGNVDFGPQVIESRITNLLGAGRWDK